MRNLIYIFICLFLSGCEPISIMSSVAGATAYLSYQHSKAGGLRHRMSDYWLESKIESIWSDSKLDQPFLRVIVVKGIPVIFGASTSKEKLEEAKSLAVMKSENIQCIADDDIQGGWNTDLEVNVKFKLMMNSKISSRNYTIKAIKNHVWVIGIAQNENEKQEVITRMESMDNVKSFKYYILISPDYLESGKVDVYPNND